MKKFIIALIFFMTSSSFLFSANAVSYSENFASLVYETPEFKTPVCIKVNGSFIKSDTPAFLQNGVTMVPARAIASALDADSISWDEKNSSATIKKNDLSIILTKNGKNAQVNGKKVGLDAKSGIFAGRFYVPVRFVAETLNTQVLWDKDTYTVNIGAHGVTVPSDLVEKRDFTDNDIYWLARIINAESGGEPIEGKIAVANVVLNRVESTLYSDNIYDVIFDRNYGVQFTPTANGTIYNNPLGDSIIAAKRALLGENYAGNCLYFLNPRISTNFWIVNNRTFYRTIGKHDFYL